MTELSDDLLVAYVDGQLARDQSRAVKRVLDQDIVAAQRAESLRAAHDRLEWVFEALLEDERALLMGDLDESAMPAPRTPGLGERILARGTETIAAGAVAILLLGLGVGYAVWGSKPLQPVTNLAAPVEVPAWQEDVARAQALMSRESLEVGLDSQGNTDFVRFQLAKLLGTDVVIPDFSARGFAFARAQLLRRQAQPLAQLAYLPERGMPLALYLRPGAGADRAPEIRAVAGLVTASWTVGGMAYLLAGHTTESDIGALARDARNQISGL